MFDLASVDLFRQIRQVPKHQALKKQTHTTRSIYIQINSMLVGVSIIAEAIFMICRPLEQIKSKWMFVVIE